MSASRGCGAVRSCVGWWVFEVLVCPLAGMHPLLMGLHVLAWPCRPPRALQAALEQDPEAAPYKAGRVSPGDDFYTVGAGAGRHVTRWFWPSLAVVLSQLRMTSHLEMVGTCLDFLPVFSYAGPGQPAARSLTHARARGHSWAGQWAGGR